MTEILDVSDDVLVSVRVTLGGRPSGIELDFEVFSVGHHRDGTLAGIDVPESRAGAASLWGG